MLKVASKAAAAAPPAADESRKWLQWDEYLGMVRALRAECAGGVQCAGGQGGTRPSHACCGVQNSSANSSTTAPKHQQHCIPCTGQTHATMIWLSDLLQALGCDGPSQDCRVTGK